MGGASLHDLPLMEENVNHRIAPWYGRHTLAEQYAMMESHLAAHLAPLGLTDYFHGVLHTAPYEGYRNTNKFTFGYSPQALDRTTHDPSIQEEVRLGFISGKYPTTHILSPEKAVTIGQGFKTIAAIVEKIIRQSGLKPFLKPPQTKRKRKKIAPEAYVPHQGVWYYLKVRHSTREDKYFVTLVNFVRHLDETTRKTYETTLTLLQEALQALPQVTLFAVQEYHLTLEPQPFDPIRLLFDRSPEQEGRLIEGLGNYTFRISSTSFFQVNTKGAALLYRQIYKVAEEMVGQGTQKKKKVLLDLYCGTGSIGIYLSPLFDEVIGIDEVESSIKDAEKNSHANGVKNSKYIAGKCEESLALLDHLLGDKSNYDLYIVVNPSREGLHKKVRRYLKASGCQGLIYSSCNVETWARDVKILQQRDSQKEEGMPFCVKALWLVDLFPHTPHYEVVSALYPRATS